MHSIKKTLPTAVAIIFCFTSLSFLLLVVVKENFAFVQPKI